MQRKSYTTEGGIKIEREIVTGTYRPADTTLAEALDNRRGVLFSSSFEFPGRYTRWDMGFVDPPLIFAARGRAFSVEALNARGGVLIPAITSALRRLDSVEITAAADDRVDGAIRETTTRFPEEQRSRQPSVFSVLRALIALFKSAEDEHLGFYGAFGYDLVFQFEPMTLRLPRPADQRDLVLYLPDEILIVDHMRQQAAVHRYDFAVAGKSTAGMTRETAPAPYRIEASRVARARSSDHAKGEYAALVERAKGSFVRGDLFEVVCGQLFEEGCADPPSLVFERLKRANAACFVCVLILV
jgi:anthranilate synthase